jgi:large subunit ribosomal protein L21
MVHFVRRGLMHPTAIGKNNPWALAASAGTIRGFRQRAAAASSRARPRKTLPAKDLRRIAMYAIIATDGRQYKVEEGQEIQVDLREAKDGEKVTFDRVLLVSDGGSVKVGQPTVAGASVTAEVLGQEMGDKIYVQKIRRRKNYRRRTGHRQMYTRVRIDSIAG